MRSQILVICTLAALAVASVSESAAQHQRAPEMVATAGDLSELLQEAARNFKVGIVAELAQPYPDKVKVAARQDAAAFFDELISLCPEYSWEWREGIIWFYHRQLAEAEGNFLNARMEKVNTPSDLATFYWYLPMYVSMAQGRGGGVLAGGGTAHEKGIPLRQETMENLTIRGLLFWAGGQIQSHNDRIFSLVLFPHAFPLTEADTKYATGHWFRTTRKQLIERPVRFRSESVPQASAGYPSIRVKGGRPR